MWDPDINPNSIRTTPKVKQHLIKSLMIFGQTISDYGVYQRSYIKPLYLEESSSRLNQRWIKQGILNQGYVNKESVKAHMVLCLSDQLIVKV